MVGFKIFIKALPSLGKIPTAPFEKKSSKKASSRVNAIELMHRLVFPCLL
jgi:hypothetical protein